MNIVVPVKITQVVACGTYPNDYLVVLCEDGKLYRKEASNRAELWKEIPGPTAPMPAASPAEDAVTKSQIDGGPSSDFEQRMEEEITRHVGPIQEKYCGKIGTSYWWCIARGNTETRILVWEWTDYIQKYTNIYKGFPVTAQAAEEVAQALITAWGRPE